MPRPTSAAGVVFLSDRTRNQKWGFEAGGAALVLVAAFLAPAVRGGSASDPEIVDAPDDVSPASFAAQGGDPALFANFSAYDIVKAWVGLESEQDFWIFIQVKDLADNLHPSAQPPPNELFGPNLTFAGVQLVANFTILGQTYQAVAKLASPESGALMDNYTLWRDGWYLPIAGAYNPGQNWVALDIPKGPVGDPGRGAFLTQFWTLGGFGNYSLDFAPNARDFDPGSASPGVLLGGLQGQRLVTPQYGRAYAFGQAPTLLTADLRLAFVGSPQIIVAAGETAAHEFLVTNAADASDTVFLAASSSDPGWSQQLSASEFVLPAHAARHVWLNVTPADGIREGMRTIVYASSGLGAARSLTFVTVPRDAEGPGSSEFPTSTSGPADPTRPPKDPAGAKPKTKTPGFELLLAVAAIAVFLAVARRRPPT